MNSTPLFTAIVAHYQTQDEKLTGGRLVGVVAGMAGVAVMIGPSALNGSACVTPLVTAAGQVTASFTVPAPGRR